MNEMTTKQVKKMTAGILLCLAMLIAFITTPLYSRKTPLAKRDIIQTLYDKNFIPGDITRQNAHMKKAPELFQAPFSFIERRRTLQIA